MVKRYTVSDTWGGSIQCWQAVVLATDYDALAALSVKELERNTLLHAERDALAAELANTKLESRIRELDVELDAWKSREDMAFKRIRELEAGKKKPVL